MGKINTGRVVLGGLLAGLMLNVWDFLVNGVWLKAEWNAATQALGKGMIGGGQIVWFVVYDFLIGITLVWLYAAIRPRFGAGPKTAAIAGFVMWLVIGLFHTIAEAPIGLFPHDLYVKVTIAALIGLSLAAQAGGWQYKEV